MGSFTNWRHFYRLLPTLTATIWIMVVTGDGQRMQYIFSQKRDEYQCPISFYSANLRHLTFYWLQPVIKTRKWIIGTDRVGVGVACDISPKRDEYQCPDFFFHLRHLYWSVNHGVCYFHTTRDQLQFSNW